MELVEPKTIDPRGNFALLERLSHRLSNVTDHLRSPVAEQEEGAAKTEKEKQEGKRGIE